METLDFPSDVEGGPSQIEWRKRTISAWFVCILGKIGLYNKAGVTIWTLLACVLVSVGFYDSAPVAGESFNMVQTVNLMMASVVFILVILTPTAVYKLKKNSQGVLQDWDLKAPTNVVLLAIPILKSVVHIVVMLLPAKNGDPLHNVPWVLFDFFLGFCILLPNILAGIAASTLKFRCRNFQKKPHNKPQETSNQLLVEYRAIKSGCEFTLFIMFVGKTLSCIGLGYLVAMKWNGCYQPDLARSIAYSLYLLSSVPVLIYLGFTMEDCFNEFKATAIALRSVHFRGRTIFFSTSRLLS